MPLRRVDLLGVPLDRLTLPELFREVEGFVGRDERRTIAYLNLHVLDRCAFDAALVRFLRGVDLCYCDGRGVLLVARVLGVRLDADMRYTGADWIWEFAAWAEGRFRVAWVAGEPGVVEAAASHLQARHPALHIDAFHGFHPKEGSENLALIARVNAARPDILLVGMGTPLQERWVLENRPRLQVPVVWCLGATADFVSGKVPRGPELLLGQEWLARLVVDPKRLWRRYLLGNWRVMGRALGTRIAKGRAGNEPASA